ncbi:MAG TPA: tyrosine-type recombinase/integrase [Anaerolineae bacterium]|nr:tyrosine-type recombinase/integrase [Anaerolineae bacterium]
MTFTTAVIVDNSILENNESMLQSNRVLAVIADSGLADDTIRKYSSAMARFLDDGHSITDAHILSRYASKLPSESARRHLKAAVSLWSREVEKQLKAVVTPATTQATQAAIWRLEALRDAIQVNPVKGEGAHIWLTLLEQEKLLAAVDTSTIKGQRDNVLLRLLLGVGLRRTEATQLKFDMIITMGEMPVVHFKGKGNKKRIVPIGQRLAGLLDAWRELAGDGFVLRSVNQKGEIGDSLSDVSIFRIVRGYGRAIGKPDLAPHDIRRSFAENLRRNRIDLATISRLLGHESVETTMRYLNADVDLSVVAADFIPW